MESTKILCADSPHKENCKRKPWTSHEDAILLRFISLYGEARWDSIAQASGLNRSGKSCRLRWLNYLRPDLKRTRITSEEEQLIIHLHKRWGNRWSRIAQYLPGRTDNQIKNYFRNHINKKKDIRNSLVKEIQPSDSGSEAQDDWSIYDLNHTLKKTSDLNGAVEAAFAETNVFGFNDEARLFADSISCSAGTLYTSEESFTEYCTDYQLWS